MGQDNASHHHHAMSVLRSDQAAKVNGLGVRRVPRRWKKIFIKDSHTRLPYRLVQKSGQFWVRVLHASKLTTNSAFSRGNRMFLLTLCQEFWIPLGVAMDIAKANDVETQRELLKAYETKQLNQLSIRTVKRIIDQRRFAGKHRDIRNGAGRKRLTSAESLVHAYRRESQKQKLMIRKAKICDAKLVFIVTAFDKLVRDENFMTLLRAESLSTMPKYLWTKLNPKHEEAA
jgi:hypothetical protein